MPIDRETFWRNLYVHHDDAVKAVLRVTLAEGQNMLCLIGPAGGGKTTFVSHVLENDLPRGTRYVRIDFKQERELSGFFRGPLADISGEDGNALRVALERILVDTLKTEFYEHGSVKYHGKEIDCSQILDRVVRRLLTMPPSEAPYKDLLRGMRGLRERVRRMPTAPQKDEALTPFILDSNDPSLIALVRDFREQLTAVQLIWGLSEFNIADRFLLVFDNVDRLSPLYQFFYFALGNALYESTRGAVRTVVVIREENIRKENPFLPVPSDTYVDEYFLVESNFFKKQFKGPGVRLHAITGERVKAIIDARLGFLLECFDNSDPALGDLDVAAVRRFKEISDYVLATYDDERFARIANGNSRVLLSMHTSFVGHLDALGIVPHGTIEALSPHRRDRVKHLVGNAFYSWLKTDPSKIDLWCYDLGSALEPDRDAPKCFIEHLILAYLSNLQQGTGAVHGTFQRLRADFTRLGYSEQDVLDAVRRLYGDPANAGSFVQISALAAASLAKDRLPGNAELWVTPRGREFVRRTSHKYHFILASLGHGPLADLDLESRSFQDGLRDVEDFCRQLMEFHVGGLRKIRARFDGRADWLSAYKEKFCVHVRDDTGTVLPKLHLDLITYNVTQFFRNVRRFSEGLGFADQARLADNARERFERLAAEFRDRVAELDAPPNLAVS
ncbi:MAG TPA: hypothetical protein VGB18_03310 [Candidatus Thermoplasmatota archaeon]